MKNNTKPPMLKTISEKEYDKLIKASNDCAYYKEKSRSLMVENERLKEENSRFKRIALATQSEKRLIVNKNFDCLLNEIESVYSEYRDRSEFIKNETDSMISSMRNLRPNDEIDDNMNYLFVHHFPYYKDGVCPLCGFRLQLFDEFPRTKFKLNNEKAILRDDIYGSLYCKKCGFRSENPYTAVLHKAPVLGDNRISAEAIAQLIVNKFSSGMSLAYQEMFWEELGLKFPAYVMSSWLMEATVFRFRFLYEALRNDLVGRKIIYSGTGNITSGKLSENKTLFDPASDKYVWLYQTPHEDEKPVILYDIKDSSDYTDPERFLSGFRGILQTADYDVFDPLREDIDISVTWSRAQEFFEAAYEFLDPKLRENSYAEKGMELCQMIINNEETVSGSDKEIRQAMRRIKSLPLIESLCKMAKDYFSEISGSSTYGKTGQAFAFVLDYEQELKRYIQDGDLSTDNDHCEIALHKFVLSENRWKISDDGSGYDIGMILCSIVETVKKNGLSPYRYLTFFLKHSESINSGADISRLLPWNAPDECKEVYLY